MLSAGAVQRRAEEEIANEILCPEVLRVDSLAGSRSVDGLLPVRLGELVERVLREKLLEPVVQRGADFLLERQQSVHIFTYYSTEWGCLPKISF